MLPQRFLIVNADDLGMSEGINAGIIEAHRRGIVTSASLMVKHPQAQEAARMAAAEPALGLGLHVDITEWEPVDGVSTQTYSRADLDDQLQVAAEMRSQLALFVELVGRNPDHLDSHQHVHWKGPTRDESILLARKLGVPLRGLDERVRFCGDFYGQRRSGPYPEGITKSNLLRLVEAMDAGWTELMCHPGFARDLQSVYGSEREVELATLCDPELPAALAERGVALRSFRELKPARA